MSESGNASPERRPPEKTSLFGVFSFRPRVAAVLAFLTVTVAVVAFRMARDADLRRIETLVREATKVYAAVRNGEADPPRDPAQVEERLKELTGVAQPLPRDGDAFSYGGVSRVNLGRRAAAAVRLTWEGDPYVLVVLRRETLRGGGGASLFDGSGFVSGDRDGLSFVYWERDGASFILVSAADLSRAFDLVRRYLT